MEDVKVKAEGDTESGSPQHEDDYEDAGDLEFYDSTLPGDPMGTMYLARLPNYLWKIWDTLDEDEEINIGTIRQWQDTDKSGKPAPKLQLLLRGDLDPHKDIPKEYDLDVIEASVSNTFVFTEQDLPGFAAKNKQRANALASGIPAHLLRQKLESKEPEHDQRGRVKKPRDMGRRAIPKKTTIAGRIKHELLCKPMTTTENDLITALRAVKQQRNSKEEKKTVVIDGPIGSSTAVNYDQNFVKTVETKPDKAKRMENKTARMPENELLDILFHCFNEYAYWPMKTLRARVHQPEQYLRETLDKIAVLNRTGTFANTWSLQPEVREQVTKMSRAPVQAAAPDSGEVDDGDDDDVKMEDVI